MSTIRIVPAVEQNTLSILEMIRELAEYEKLGHLVTATEEKIRGSLFGVRPVAEVLMAYSDAECAGFALFFPNYSTFLGQAGIYLEDLYVKPQFRGKGIGFALLQRLAKVAAERGCGRVEWAVLDWNQPSIDFYKRIGAVPLEDWILFRLTGEALLKLASSNRSI